MLRIVTGALMAFHGWEIFTPETMAEYGKWLVERQLPGAAWLSYVGKAAELLGGLSLLFGALTRLGALAIIPPMVFVCFVLGNGKFWYGDQHPFMFILLAVLFLFGGAGKWSVDARLFDKKSVS